jgi:hypothetical protein
MASGGGAPMKYRMHKRVETKPDGRKIYYYTFEPAQERQSPHDAPAEPAPRKDAEPSPAGDSVGR